MAQVQNLRDYIIKKDDVEEKRDKAQQVKRKDGTFFNASRNIIRLKTADRKEIPTLRLEPEILAVYWILESYRYDFGDPEVTPAIKTVHKQVKLSLDSIQVILRYLQDIGLMVVREVPNKRGGRDKMIFGLTNIESESDIIAIYNKKVAADIKYVERRKAVNQRKASKVAGRELDEVAIGELDTDAPSELDKIAGSEPGKVSTGELNNKKGGDKKGNESPKKPKKTTKAKIIQEYADQWGYKFQFRDDGTVYDCRMKRLYDKTDVLRGFAKNHPVRIAFINLWGE